MAYGQSGYLAISFQDSYGTSNTNSAVFLPLVSESISENIGQLVENNLYGRFAESPSHEGAHEIDGDIATEAHPIALGVLLKAALGNVVSLAQDSSFLHEFLPAASDWDAFAAVPPMTIEVFRDAGSAFIYYDMLGTTLSLEIAQGQLLTAGLGVLGGRFEQQVGGAAAFPSGKPWSWDVVSASYDGAGIADLRQVSLVFDNQLSNQFTLSSEKAPRRTKRTGSQTVAIEGTMLFQDQSLFQEYRGQTEKRLLLTFAGQTVADSYRTNLSLDIPSLRLSKFNPQISGPGQLEVGFSGKGVFDTASGYAVRLTLTNTHAGY